nr:MAG: capsid protein [Longfin eel circovirus]
MPFYRRRGGGAAGDQSGSASADTVDQFRRNRNNRMAASHHRPQIIRHIQVPKEGWGGSLYWTLNRFTSQKAWDYYRINKVVVQFITGQSAAFNRDMAAPPYAATLKNNVRPMNVSYIDYDDATPPKAPDLNAASCRMWKGETDSTPGS